MTYWESKLARNIARDREVSSALESHGWDVIRIWEHMPVEEAVLLVSEALAAD
jgi:DNA mismatch endonuclease (patch repair protein)